MEDIMNVSRLDKLAPLSGAISVLLLIVGAVTFGVYDYLPSEDRLQIVFNENHTRVSLAGYIGLLSAFFLILFAGSIYNTTHKLEKNTGWLSMIAFGGGAASGITLAAAYTALYTAGARASTVEGINPIEAVMLYDYYGHLMGQMYAMTLAVFVGASAAVSMRTSLFRAWFGWVSIVIALGLLTPISYLIVGLAQVWLLGMSLWLYRRTIAVQS
jgi:hypothetical protein